MSKPDMSVTIGHIIDNPDFDLNAPFELREAEPDNECYWITTYSGDGWDVKGIPPEVLCRPVRHLTIVDHKLVIEYDWRD